MKIRASASALLCVLFLSACASSSDVKSLERSIKTIEQAIFRIAQHQSTIDDQFAALYQESEEEISRLKQSVEIVRDRTEGLDFITNESGSVIVPSDNSSSELNRRVVLALSRTSFWKRSGGRDAKHSGNHVYQLDVEQGGTATINLFSSVSPPADTYLFLLDENGAQLDSDDDSGEGGHARILKQLDAGRYQVVAATFNVGVNAAYVLKVDGIKGRLISPAS